MADLFRGGGGGSSWSLKCSRCAFPRMISGPRIHMSPLRLFPAAVAAGEPAERNALVCAEDGGAVRVYNPYPCRSHRVLRSAGKFEVMKLLAVDPLERTALRGINDANPKLSWMSRFSTGSVRGHVCLRGNITIWYESQVCLTSVRAAHVVLHKDVGGAMSILRVEERPC